MTADVVLIGVTAIVMVVGLAGTVLPILPGLWLIWGAGLVYGILDGFGAGAVLAMVVLTVLAGGGTAAGIVVPQRHATQRGLPVWGQLAAAALAVVGMFIIPVVGAPIGFVVGVVLVMLVLTRDLGIALPAARDAVTGLVLASGVQLITGVVMVVVWAVWVVAG